MYDLAHDLDEVINQLDGPISSEKAGQLREKLEKLKNMLGQDDPDDVDYKAALDSMNEGIYITDKNLVVRYMNPAYTRLTFLEPEEVLGKKTSDLVKEGMVAKAASPEALRTKRKQILLGYIRTVEGKNLYGYCTVHPIFDSNEEVRNIVLIMYEPESLKRRYEEYVRGNSGIDPPVRIREGVHDKNGIEPAVGSSESLKNVYSIAQRVALTDATILIYGESGVGKEGVADYIYANSQRRNNPFVKINCTAIPPNLLESELFGYEKGAFTGANSKGKLGLFETADKGTILLDEIGDLPMDLQAKLLRVIQQKEIMRIGGYTPIKLDVRIISSTNADLKKKVREGKFREDLYYRLSTIPIHVPPLRDRREDILDIINYYLDYFSQQHHRTLQLSDEILMFFERFDWPGNIRQLRNIIEYLVICAEDEYMTNLKPLLRILEVDENAAQNNMLPSLDESVNSFEKGIITQVIKKTGGVRKAAKALGVAPATLSRKISKYNIQLPERHTEKEEDI